MTFIGTKGGPEIYLYGLPIQEFVNYIKSKQDFFFFFFLSM